jgi:hypothetical protein
LEKDSLFKLLKENNLKDLIDKNLNPNKIIKELDLKKEFNINYYLIKTFIKENYKLIWDTKTKQWIEGISSMQPDNKQADTDYSPLASKKVLKNQLDGQTSLVETNNGKYTTMDNNSILGAPRNTNTTSPQISQSMKVKKEYKDESSHNTHDENSTKNNFSYEELYPLLNNIDERINKLESLYNGKKNKVNKSDVDLTAEIDEVIKLFTGEKNKKSVNINIALKERVVKSIYERYGIKGNDSLAINIALLLVMYMK